MTNETAGNTMNDINTQALWQKLRGMVDMVGSREWLENHVGHDPKLIYELIQAAHKGEGEERHFDVKGQKERLQLSWPEGEKPLLSVEGEAPEDFMQSFADEYAHNPAPVAQGGRKKSLSDLAFANFAKHGRQQYMCLDGSDD